MNNYSNKCYICGIDKDLTKDHVPPEGFFPSPKPNNLITLPCCKRDNESFSSDDEAFRIFASSQKDRSKAGEWIWSNKVMSSSFKRSPSLKANVIKSIVPLKKDRRTGLIEWGLQFPKCRAEKFLIRVTKGMLRYYFPEADYSTSKFKISHIIPNQSLVDKTLARFIYDERGEGVFRVWYALIDRKKASGVWVYVFNDAVMFMVEVDLDEIMSRED